VNYIQRSFHLEGPSGLGRFPRPELIGPLLTRLPQTLQDSVRMGFLHSSRARGRIAAELKAAAEVQFVGVEAEGRNGTAVTFRAPRFGDAAPSLFSQGKFWDDSPSPDATAFDLLGHALRDIGEQRADSVHFDQPLLQRIGSYGRLLNHGIVRIVLEDPQASSSRIDSEVVKRADTLAHATPGSRRVRVVGCLDLMGASQGVIKIHVGSNTVVTALWNGAEPIEAHRDLFNKDVIVEGLGVFRPSGSLLRIEADALLPASAQDDFFRKVPTATPVTDYQRIARLRPGEESGYAAIRGIVPAEESDEDFIAALEALR